MNFAKFSRTLIREQPWETTSGLPECKKDNLQIVSYFWNVRTWYYSVLNLYLHEHIRSKVTSDIIKLLPILPSSLLIKYNFTWAKTFWHNVNIFRAQYSIDLFQEKMILMLLINFFHASQMQLRKKLLQC